MTTLVSGYATSETYKDGEPSDRVQLSFRYQEAPDGHDVSGAELYIGINVYGDGSERYSVEVNNASIGSQSTEVARGRAVAMQLAADIGDAIAASDPEPFAAACALLTRMGITLTLSHAADGDRSADIARVEPQPIG